MVFQSELGEPIQCKSAAYGFIRRLRADFHVMPLPADGIPIHDHPAFRFTKRTPRRGRAKLTAADAPTRAARIACFRARFALAPRAATLCPPSATDDSGRKSKPRPNPRREPRRPQLVTAMAVLHLIAVMTRSPFLLSARGRRGQLTRRPDGSAKMRSDPLVALSNVSTIVRAASRAHWRGLGPIWRGASRSHRRLIRATFP
jgi:hypothetical protein